MSINLANKEYLIKAIHDIEDYSIIFLDVEGKVLDWNNGAKRTKGYSESEIIGKNFRAFYTPEDLILKKPDRLIQEALRTGRANDEGWRVRKDGSLFWGSITISSVYDEFDKLIGFSKVTRDLSERKKSDDKIEKNLKEITSKNKELEQFTYLTSHDLQEPLRTIISFSEYLVEEINGDNNREDILEYAYFISNASKRMRDLVASLLDYSRLGKTRELTVVNLNKVVADVIDDLGATIKASKAEIQVSPLPYLQGYATELRLLFQNLISNSLKFNLSGKPIISIGTKENDTNFVFSVKDNGIGIEERNIKKVFMIFKRLHNRSEYEGNGIGLSHCKKIIEMHGGKIWVESIYGEGSTFYFEIPKTN